MQSYFARSVCCYQLRRMQIIIWEMKMQKLYYIEMEKLVEKANYRITIFFLLSKQLSVMARTKTNNLTKIE